MKGAQNQVAPSMMGYKWGKKQMADHQRENMNCLQLKKTNEKMANNAKMAKQNKPKH